MLMPQRVFAGRMSGKKGNCHHRMTSLLDSLLHAAHKKSSMLAPWLLAQIPLTCVLH